ncbi:helix-turn-helix domain-containing protein [Rheinheimera oceanensis]|uniref:helix-turn-helix domain-containing protein n=1 Tax=Rheinheimera oceanensis TaxID=2817449 RepID=UPI001BFE7CA3
MEQIICSWTAYLKKGTESIFPDGCRDIIVILGKDHSSNIICSGLDTTFRMISCREDTKFIGVRLSPGVSFSWDKRHNSCKLKDIDVTSYFPKVSHGLNNDVESEDVAVQLLEAVKALVEPAPVWLDDYFEDLSFDKVSPLNSLSERSIRRKLVQITGAPPRFWNALARVRYAGLELIRSEAPLASIAIESGFSDQAHMSREMQHWFGSSPRAIRHNKERVADKLTAPSVFSRFNDAQL